MKASCLIFVLISIAFHAASAQCKEWNWPADKAKAQEQMALLQDAVRAKDYVHASRPLNWLLSAAPKLNVSLYIRAAEVYEGRIAMEKDSSRRETLIDSLLEIYDLRIRFCGDVANVANRKALAAFRHLINGPTPEKLLPLMDKALRLNGVRVMDATLVPYMETLAVMHLKKKMLSEDEILNRYDTLTIVLDGKLKAAKADPAKVEKLTGYKKQIDELLLKVIKVDCKFINDVLAPRYRKNPADLTLAKRIFGFMLIEKCDRDSLWLETGEFIFTKEKDFGLAKNLALQFYSEGRFDKATQYFNESLKIASAGRDSAEVYSYMGSMKTKQGNLPEARAEFRKALKADPTFREAYEKIGDLYYNSFKACSREKSMADDRAVYLIAYDCYEKAGSQEKMAFAQKSFPSREEIFLMNYKAGEKIHVNCWIDETSVIRTRD
jgi:tetratricopeptide (TPR) repeat protein